MMLFRTKYEAGVQVLSVRSQVEKKYLVPVGDFFVHLRDHGLECGSKLNVR